MSDYARRVFRVQLASVMDALLKTAVCEIAKIFEGSLCEQQTELTQRCDQISALQGRLLAVESRLRAGGGDLETVAQLELYTDVESTSQTISSVVTDNTGTELEGDNVPDDWCAPIQWDEPEDPPKEEMDGECPSVTLRPLRVALWRMPSVKHEVQEDFESHLMTALSTSPPFKREEGSLERRFRRRIERRLTASQADSGYGDHAQDGGKEKTKDTHFSPDTTKTRKYKKENGSTNNKDQVPFSCMYCPRVFQTEAGLKVHTWSHQRCYKCHKTFSSPNLLRQHIRVIHNMKKEEQQQNNNNHKFNFANLLHSCKQCTQRFYTMALLKEHVESAHTYEPWEDEEEGNGDIVWTVPMEEPDNQQPSPKSKSKRTLDSSPASAGHVGRPAKVKKEGVKTPVSPVQHKVKPGTDEKSSGSQTKLKATGKSESKDGVRKKIYKKKDSRSCKYCHKLCATEHGLKMHVLSHKKCAKCHKVFEYPSFLRQHMTHCHRAKAEKDSKDSTEEKQKNNNHHKVSSPKLHSCKHCSQKFDTKLLLSKHVKKDHEDEPWEDEEGKGELSWTVPMDEPADQQPSAKSSSSKDQKDPETWQRRNRGKGQNVDSKGKAKKKTTDPKGFKCQICKKILSCRSTLMEHLRLHTGEKPVPCVPCGRQFRCHPDLSRHRKLGCPGLDPLEKKAKESEKKRPKESEKKPSAATEKVRCQECDRTFSTHEKLTNHRRVVHRKKLIACKICGKGFSYVGRLTAHYERAHP